MFCLDMPFLAYHGCSKLLKARAVFYRGTHTRFSVSGGIDPSLTKTRRTRSADCICMDKRARLYGKLYITCIVYLGVRQTEYFTEILRNIPRIRDSGTVGPFFSSPGPAINGLALASFYAHEHEHNYYVRAYCSLAVPVAVRPLAMAASSESYLEPQQICDYVLLRHVNVGKDSENEKLYKVQPIFLCILCRYRNDVCMYHSLEGIRFMFY